MRPGFVATMVLGGVAAFVLLCVLALFVFQENVSKFLIAPRTPYQIYTPPPSPDYDLSGSWYLRDAGAEAAGADIFYVHSTTYYGAEDWNAPIGDADAQERFARIAAPNEAGPFAPLGRLIAPKYRQATLFAFFTHKNDGRDARRAAYADVQAAFHAYLHDRDADRERPLILVGYGQGGLHVLRILEEYFQSDAMRSRLVGAYVIDAPTPLDLFQNRISATPVCEGPEAIRCVVAYTAFSSAFEAEIRRARMRGMVWAEDGDLEPVRDRPLACVNPLTWRPGDTAGAENHIGAASATGLNLLDDAIPIPRAIGAACRDGVLVTDQPDQTYLRRRSGFGRQWRVQNHNLFYYDLRENALQRLAAWRAVREEERRRAPPIGAPEEVGDAPIVRIDE